MTIRETMIPPRTKAAFLLINGRDCLPNRELRLFNQGLINKSIPSSDNLLARHREEEEVLLGVEVVEEPIVGEDNNFRESTPLVLF